MGDHCPQQQHCYEHLLCVLLVGLVTWEAVVVVVPADVPCGQQ